MLQQCKCNHPDQDELHGKQIRVHTESKDGGVRCTVCGPKARKQIRLDIHANNHIKAAHG